MNEKPNGVTEPQEPENFASLDELEKQAKDDTASSPDDLDNLDDVSGSPETLEENVPEKYQGKSLDDVIRMHQEAEKLASRTGQELGELRKHADAFITRQLSEPTSTSVETSSTNFDDIVKDPESAVRNIVEKDLGEIKEQLATREREESAMRFYAKYPEAQGILENTQFRGWVEGSPLRMRLLEQGNNFDFDAAGELMELYSMSHPDTSEEDAKALESKAKAHATSKAKGGAGSATRKVYRRSDIVSLMMDDPARYQAMLPEIKKAYAENRVK